MILAVAATEMEAASFRTQMAKGQEAGSWSLLISGVGILETAARLGQYLAKHQGRVQSVVQFGIGGAYIGPGKDCRQAGILSLCLAEKEVLGDLGVELGDGLEYFSRELVSSNSYGLNPALRDRAIKILAAAGHAPLVGNFITVNSASGTRRRGEVLRSHWGGLCENMEGAAAARICALYDIPMLELRTISNMVEDRNLQNWQLGRACEMAGEAAALLIKEFS